MTKPKPGLDSEMLAEAAALPEAKRKAVEAVLARELRRASYVGGKRGPKPKLGETMNDRVLVKCSTTLRKEIEAAAKELGFDNGPDYLRELHRRHVARKKGEG